MPNLDHAILQDRTITPDVRFPNGPRYAVVEEMGFQAPRILGEGETSEEAWRNAKDNYNPPEPRRPSYEELETTTQTRDHIDLVRILLREFAVELLLRGETHDRSKLDRAEVDTFTKYTGRLKEMTYGTDEYKQCLEEMGKDGGPLRHHYDHNRHHPEHFADCVEGMNLIDILEMFVDWKASVRRGANGDLNRSIEINQKRFNMSDQLTQIFRNTVRDYGK